jgi:hypothetical protein
MMSFLLFLTAFFTSNFKERRDLALSRRKTAGLGLAKDKFFGHQKIFAFSGRWRASSCTIGLCQPL